VPTGQKHLIKCRCVLLQFRKRKDPPVHQFTVFSVVDDDDKVKTKFAQCPNCGIVHKVVDICRSELLLNREAMSSIVTIDDIKISLPEVLVTILSANIADLPTWEAAQFIYENKQWGQFVVLNSDTEEGIKQGKYLMILGEKLFKIEQFTREEVIK